MNITTHLPCRLVNTANAREHWGKRARRAKMQRWTTLALVRSALQEAGFRWHPDSRLQITITRIGPGNRPMDTDGLANAAKPIRDGIADALKVDDGDRRNTWLYAQVRGPYGCDVRITSKARELNHA